MAYNLEGYVTVAERLTQAHDQIVTVVTEPPVLLTDVMGYIRSTVALKDGRSATATASFRLDLQNRSAQATNPLEDCETSAIGRALGFLGYGSTKSVASREEVQEAQKRSEQGAQYQPRQQPQQQRPIPEGAPPLCPVHKKAMRAGNNGGYFCATKVGTDEQGKDMWCKARPDKPAPTPDTSEWDAIDNAPSVRRRGAVVEESLL